MPIPFPSFLPLRHALAGAVALCGLATGLSMACLAACLDMWLTGGWAAVAALAVFGSVWPGPGLRRALSAAVLAVALGLGAWGRQWPLVEFGAFMDRAAQDIEARGAAALATRHRIGVYGLNLAMGAAGHAAGLDEVAQLTWLLAVPGPRVRERDGAFLLRDPAVRAALPEALRRGEARVAWTHYVHPQVSPSVALAANCPLVLHGTAQGGVVAQCRVRYPRHSRLPLGRVAGREVAFEEGVYWVLQENGWLHPYEVTWRLSAPAIAVAPRHPDPVWLCRERLWLALLAP